MLRGLPESCDPNVLVGFSKASDAGVYRIADDLALVQTVDFFTPIVDDPLSYGRIAAANSLSDVYAMGGRPVTALNVVLLPSTKVPAEVIERIFQGGYEKAREAGCSVVGGHSVEGPELLYGMSVTGLVEPSRLVTNESARPGDALVLTKALGTGIITTAAKLGKLPAGSLEEILGRAVASMEELNREAALAMLEAGAHAATDITGFGLIGHAVEFASASGVTFRIDGRAVPVLDGALELAGRGVVTGADRRNRAFTDGKIVIGPAVGDALSRVLFDAQTSGGLLVSLPADRAQSLVARLANPRRPAAARVIGVVVRAGPVSVAVE